MLFSAGGMRAVISEVGKRTLGPRFLVKHRVKSELANGEPELRLLPLLCDPTRSFLDIGANNGVYSWFAKSYAKHVIAAEPLPETIGMLRKIFLEDATLLEVAASDRGGTAVLTVPVRGGRVVDTRCSLQADANPGFETREIVVATQPIDAMNLPPLGLIKIDVEGHELAVLKGATATLARDRPALIVECEERHNAGGVVQCFDHMKALGFAAFYIHRGSLKNGSMFDVDVLQNEERSKPVSGVRNRDYVNNFIFLPEEAAELEDKLRRNVPKLIGVFE